MDFIKGNADVFEKILSYLSVKDILNCNLVCKAWYTQTNVNSIWKRFCEEEDIDPEEWDWDITDGDEWLLDTPCKWKNYFLNKQKTLFNWRNNICKVEELIEFTSSINTAYDGKTLVVRDGEHLRVYNIKKNDIKFLQLLQYNETYYYDGFTTNTDYIVIHNYGSIRVYILVDIYYKLDYSIKYENINDQLIYTKEVVKFPHLQKYKLKIFHMWILGEILYIIYFHGTFDDDINVYLWNLKEKRQLLHLTDIKHFFTHDNKYSYIVNELKPMTTDDDSCYKITVYNKKGEVYYVINTKFCLNRLYINRHLVIGFEYNGKQMIAWNKQCGREVIPCKILNFDTDEQIYFHSKSDIIITYNGETKLLTGYQLYNIEKLWVLNTEHLNLEGTLLYGSTQVYGIMFLFGMCVKPDFMSSTRRSMNTCELKYDSVNIQAYNAYSGIHLYSIEVNDMLQSNLMNVYNDLIIYTDGKKSLIIRLYR